MMSDRCNIFDAHTKILDSVSEAAFESFRILQNKEQRRKSTSLHCGFIYSVKTTLSIEEMEKISLQYCGCLPTLRGYLTFPFMSQTTPQPSPTLK